MNVSVRMSLNKIIYFVELPALRDQRHISIIYIS